MFEMQGRSGRVLVVTTNFGGGTGSHIAGISRRWIEAGWAVEILCQGPAQTEMTRGLSVVMGPSNSIFNRFPIAQIRCLMQFRQHLKAFRPDIVHCFFFWSIAFGRLLKRLGDIDLLIENREDQGFNWGKREYRLLRRSKHLPDRVVCVSGAVRDVVLEKEGLVPSKVRIIRNGIELCTTSPVKEEARSGLGIRESELVVGMVANLNRPVKGVHHFIEAMPRILEFVPSTRFLIFGDGHLKADLERQAQSMGVEDRILFAGYRSDMDRHYAAFDVAAMTSLSEGLSIAILEYMQHGLPAVVTDVGGNRELITNDVNGFLVPPRDTNALAQRVTQLLLDPALRNRMGAAGREIAELDFDLDHVAREYLKNYGQLMGIEDVARRAMPTDENMGVL